MALHDPDPDIHRKQMELKLGRQKKIQMIDGQQVEVVPGGGPMCAMNSEGEEEEEEDEIDMMAVEGADGQQYVVLEVIQLADGEERTMVVSGGGADGTTAAAELLGEGVLDETDLNDEDVLKALETARVVTTKQEMGDEEMAEEKVSNDMKNCFGFDEEEEDDDENLHTNKDSMTLLHNIG
ncbi:unnamed protein product [Acanthoscelides obtectus]|nr:unnamed protein product [Acanthoscelides obtectus]CAK1656244.1 hypothetical protein AOBTE_LOCUS19626 [Acanthoscelides obtectus]